MSVKIKDLDGKVIYTWEGTNLRDAELHYEDLQNANLRGADLVNVDLRLAKLRGADLRGAELRGASFRRADLRSAILQEVRDADFSGANLRGTGLTKEILTIGGAWFDRETKFDNICSACGQDMPDSEALRASAASKLTPAERAVLGL